MISSYHTPVLLPDVLSGLSIKKDSWYVDGTLGGGGYSAAILQNGGKIIGIDIDTDAIEFAGNRLKDEFPQQQQGKDWILVHDNFRNIKKIVTDLKISNISGIVFDLGVSSFQLDQKTRGFSYRFPDAPLDLRMNQNQGVPASTIINAYSKEELYDIFTKFGEEERSWSVVHAIWSARHVKPIETVGEVIEAIKTVGGEKDRILARIFQALRIAVNDELGALEEGLEGAQNILLDGGRFAIVSFHSLEDRLVKRFFQRPGWKKITDVVRASEQEQYENSRSRSAKLRVGEKILL